MLKLTLATSPLQPDKHFLAQVAYMLDEANDEYEDFLTHNNDKDDLDELLEILQANTDIDNLDIDWYIGPTGRMAVDWYIQSAQVHGDGSMDIVIDPDSTIGYWGPKTFKKSVLKTVAHESIHLAQRDRMGADKYKSLPSGYQNGLRLQKKTGKERDLIRTYLRDPHELMAHGHDLAEEIKASSNPEQALRNPERFRNELPAYDKHRAIFPPNAKQLKRLLNYTARYIQNG